MVAFHQLQMVHVEADLTFGCAASSICGKCNGSCIERHAGLTAAGTERLLTSTTPNPSRCRLPALAR